MQAHSASAERGPRNAYHTDSLEVTVREHLARLLGSDQFDASARSRAFLEFIVDEVFNGREASLSQVLIARAVFGRRGDFDPVLDPIVRVQAGRLRRSLERYYLLSHDRDPIRIELPKGSYAPRFVAPTVTQTMPATHSGEAVEPGLTRSIVAIHSIRVASCADEALAARLTDELAVELCRCGDVRVARQEDIERLELAQHAAVRFELQGNLHHDADGERCLAIRLVDRATGEQVWGDSDRLTPSLEGRGDASEAIIRVVAARICAWYGGLAASRRSD